MSKRKKLFFAVAVLMLVLLAAMILGYTYAKYINSREVSSTAQVASWSFNGAITDTDNIQATTTSISLGGGDSGLPKLAPGSSGTFKILVNANGSEVDVDYDVLLKDSENNKPENLFFTCSDLVDATDDNGELIKYYSLADMLAVDSQTGRSNLSGRISKNSNSNPKVITVNWEWPYESTRAGFSQDALDEQDTTDSAIDNYSFTLKIVGKQAAQ